MPGKLYLVATPIGNLKDITLRAIDTLRTVDIVACEDTRHTRKLLSHLGIQAKLVSYHEHNEIARAADLAKRLEEGDSVAVVSDAGTPGVSDPSFRIVESAIKVGADVIPVPGPVAFVSAVIASGLPTDSIFFAGFLPSKKGERKKRLDELSHIPATLIFYESPRRVAASVADCYAAFGDRQAVIAREISKIHEEYIRGSLKDLSSSITTELKGEIVVMIDRHHGESDAVDAQISLAERLAAIEAEGVDHKVALKRLAKEFGLSRSEAYRRLQSERA